jgi:hypothetical protein
MVKEADGQIAQNKDFFDLYEIGKEVPQTTYIHAKLYECTEKETSSPKWVLRFSENSISN